MHLGTRWCRDAIRREVFWFKMDTAKVPRLVYFHWRWRRGLLRVPVDAPGFWIFEFDKKEEIEAAAAAAAGGKASEREPEKRPRLSKAEWDEL